LEILENVSAYLRKLLAKKEKKVEYYESEQFQKDLDEAEDQYKRGEFVRINSDEEIHKLIWG